MNKEKKADFFTLLNSNVFKSLRNRFDKNNMFKSISDFKHQIIKSFGIESKWYRENSESINTISNNVDSILICGMGGSAIGGELAKIILFEHINIPILINRSNNIPNWVNDKTLIIISSYSGNTYETVESFHQSRKKTKKIISISSELGIINDYSLEFGYPIINIPSGLQPRCALGYISSIIILVLARLNLVDSSKRLRMQLKESVRELNDVDRMLNNKNNPILSISHKIRNSIPIIYGIENSTSIAAIRFKNQLQENAKMISFCNNFPEINHNEIESWNNRSAEFFIIWLQDPFLDKKDNKAINAAFELIDNLKINQEIIILENKHTSKNNKLARLYKIIYFLDWVSYYLALLNNVDPISIKNIEFIKKSI